MLGQLFSFRGALLVVFLCLFMACAPSPTAEPPATLQAVLSDSAVWQGVDPSAVVVLQEQPLERGQMVLYQWHNEANEMCLTAAILFNLNGTWQPHDTFHAPCQADGRWVAAHSGNSTAESPYGPARQSLAYGYSAEAHAVRVVWADGQVNYVPLGKGGFLAARHGRIEVERVEWVDNSNNVLAIETWDDTTLN